MGPRRWLLAPCLLACGGLGGCAGFWDEVTSRDFKVQNLFSRPDPLWVILHSPDGDQKAKALRSLREPRQYGGTPEQQEVVVQALVWSAVNDPQALCRLGAMHALSHFKDPRAVDALKEAYYKAGSFNPETAAVIKCQALEALGQTGQPGGVELLVKVLREPPVEGPDQDKQQKMDERIAAARALGHFKHYQATGALVEVLRGDQDVALRHRAHESLREATGKDFPPDAQVWADFLERADRNPALAKEPGFMDRLIRLVSFEP
jgi:HEAT repeat protein